MFRLALTPLAAFWRPKSKRVSSRSRLAAQIELLFGGRSGAQNFVSRSLVWPENEDFGAKIKLLFMAHLVLKFRLGLTCLARAQSRIIISDAFGAQILSRSCRIISAGWYEF